MTEEFKEDVLTAVKSVIDENILSDEDALAIIAICKEATSRAIAEISERCLADLIAGSDPE